MRLVAALVAIAILTAACSGPPRKVGSEPSWRGPNGSSPPIVAGPVTFVPSTQPAIRYNEPVRAPAPSVLGDAVLVAVADAARKAHRPVPVADARLFRACAELAEIVPEQGLISYGLVEFALQRNGIIEPSPHLLVVWGDLAQPAAIVGQIAPRVSEMFDDGATGRVGIGAVRRLADGTGAIVFALQGSGVSTAPIPRAVAAGGAFAVDATVDGRYRDPEVFVTRDDGTTERIDVRAKGNQFSTSITCSASKGRQQIEITAVDPETGSTVLANFPVWCGQDPPIAITVEPSRDDEPITNPDEAETRLLALVNRERALASLPALQSDDRVRGVARAHSEEMRRTKLVAHVSPTTGSASDRVRVANMNSPGHRANIMSRQATRVGIGVVFGEEVSGRKELFITQVFTRVPPKIDPTEAAAGLVAKLDAVHHVTLSPRLMQIATEAAGQLAAGRTRDEMWPAVRKKVDALGGLYAKVGSVVTASSDLDALEAKALFGEYLPDDVGVGIAQGRHPQIGEDAIWIVILMATKR
ncbi:MAG: CAP domain-containing protein [Proteobacteria bacterium]|nr:CAP domain-containing protein [Pseudomonadota bacterium]